MTAGPLEAEVLAAWLATEATPGRTLVVGLNGAQGCGKSTLAARLQDVLEHDAGRRAAVLALDDFYLTRAERAALAGRVHPLLATRGVPGTHDVALLQRTLARLRTLRESERVEVPRFVKALDDRAPAGDWGAVAGPVDLVLLEGWCVGTPPQSAAELAAPVNALEAQEDADGRWRAWVNQQLATTYAALFGQLDRLVFLRAPGFEVVHGWRLEQEAGNAAAAGAAALSPAALERFIAHYERLTRHALRVLPARADVVLNLDARRRVTAARYPGA
jgi:D-glycerate 3-kinase